MIVLLHHIACKMTTNTGGLVYTGSVPCVFAMCVSILTVSPTDNECLHWGKGLRGIDVDVT